MECGMCGGEKGLLGFLGNMAHLSCRNCGMQSMMERAEFNEIVGEDFDLDNDE